ncbi:hypothetical protein BDV96DRAFT_603112 [Lophiotrema nucula]|uniref:Uncharacterized protein n=1 Tax=Lophiotrema nucula TaxID=690887 RepID=A0A6A5YXJ2_9PLEO|nr:hypothetical protein BDV96DRAFT_603112 [Lophiotrema nucula]
MPVCDSATRLRDVLTVRLSWATKAGAWSVVCMGDGPSRRSTSPVRPCWTKEERDGAAQAMVHMACEALGSSYEAQRPAARCEATFSRLIQRGFKGDSGRKGCNSARSRVERIQGPSQGVALGGQTLADAVVSERVESAKARLACPAPGQQEADVVVRYCDCVPLLAESPPSHPKGSQLRGPPPISLGGSWGVRLVPPGCHGPAAWFAGLHARSGASRETQRSGDSPERAERLCQASRNRPAAGAIPAPGERGVTRAHRAMRSTMHADAASKLRPGLSPTAAPQRKLLQSARCIRRPPRCASFSLAPGGGLKMSTAAAACPSSRCCVPLAWEGLLHHRGLRLMPRLGSLRRVSSIPAAVRQRREKARRTSALVETGSETERRTPARSNFASIAACTLQPPPSHRRRLRNLLGEPLNRPSPSVSVFRHTAILRNGG